MRGRTTRLHRAARIYARLGLPVAPTAPAAKRPFLVEGGCNAATTDLEQIDAWWSMAPNANVALGCTKASGLVAIDLDAPHGQQQWSELSAGQEHPPCPMAVTPGGGFHLLFRRPDGVSFRGRIRSHVEVKGWGTIHVAPSVHPEGGRYGWVPGARPVVDIPIPMMPPWLVELARVPDVEVLPSSPRGETGDAVERAGSYLERMDPAVSGSGGHSATFRAAVALVRGFNLPDDVALGLLVDNFNPRCAPPWSMRELRHKVRSARRHGRMAFGEKLHAERKAS